MNNDYAIAHTVPLNASESVIVRIRSSPETERNLFVFDAPDETNSIYTVDGTRYMRSMADGETSYGTEQLDSFATVHEENDLVSMLDNALGASWSSATTPPPRRWPETAGDCSDSTSNR